MNVLILIVGAACFSGIALAIPQGYPPPCATCGPPPPPPCQTCGQAERIVSYQPPPQVFKPPPSTFQPSPITIHIPPIMLQPPAQSFRPPPQTYQPDKIIWNPPPIKWQPAPYTWQPPPITLTPPEQTIEIPPQELQPPPQVVQPPESHFQPPPQKFVPPPQTIYPPPQTVDIPPQVIVFPNQIIRVPIPVPPPAPPTCQTCPCYWCKSELGSFNPVATVITGASSNYAQQWSSAGSVCGSCSALNDVTTGGINSTKDACSAFIESVADGPVEADKLVGEVKKIFYGDKAKESKYAKGLEPSTFHCCHVEFGREFFPKLNQTYVLPILPKDETCVGLVDKLFRELKKDEKTDTPAEKKAAAPTAKKPAADKKKQKA